MSEEKKNNIFTATDIERYHKGLLSASEMHEMEKAALEDPFLADALEGYRAVESNVSADLSELQKSLEERISRSKYVRMASTRRAFRWGKVAAAVIILGGLGLLIFNLTSNKKENSVAEIKAKKPDQPVATIIPDSSAKMTDSGANNSTQAVAAKSTKNQSSVRTRAKSVDTTAASAGSVATLAVSPPATAKEEGIDSVTNKPIVEGLAAPTNTKAKKPEPGAAVPRRAVDNVNEFAKVQQQMNYFNGRVVDAGNNPLPFANITNIRDDVGTYADARGYFTLISPDSILNVRVRSVGFEPGVAKLKDGRSNQVVLQEDRSAPDKILSLQPADTNRGLERTMRLEEPEPLDGWTNYNTYMANNINVPQDLKMKRDIGQVQLSFDVNDNGEPVNIKVERSLCKKCDEEAVRLIKQGPKWKQKNKKAKRVTVSVPFHTE